MTLRYSLLDEPLIRARLTHGGQPVRFSLPGLFMVLAQDDVRDFPGLRPHQRHPWHAFTVQLAAMALHRAGEAQPFVTEQAWKDALLALTPEHPDGSAWCLISPHDKPAFMQPPVPGGTVSNWKNTLHAPDELDMLVTSKNHDLKAARMWQAEPDDWVMALISLQTQEGYGGKDNWGISRMAGGFGCRVGMGAVPKGNVGQRWKRDLALLLSARQSIIDDYEFETKDSKGLLWLLPWDGSGSLTFSRLDPFYIEICRRIRLVSENDHVLYAKATTSKDIRVASNNGRGGTGDAWTPVSRIDGEALKIRVNGFSYDLAVALLFGNEHHKNSYKPPVAMTLIDSDGDEGIFAIMQAVSRGGRMGNKSVTEGYHERRIPISRKIHRLLRQKNTDYLSRVAGERVHAIAESRRLLWNALAILFNKGSEKDFSDSVKDKAGVFAKAFEQAEDALFFDELNVEIDSEDPESIRLEWLRSMVHRAETILKRAFVIGPQASERRYKAQSAALDKFRELVKQKFPSLSDYYRRITTNKEGAHESA